jgi:hypothetical protein
MSESIALFKRPEKQYGILEKQNGKEKHHSFVSQRQNFTI